MKKIVQSFYNNSPIPIQNMLITAYGYRLKKQRYGETFKLYLSKFRKREQFTIQQWRDYQTIELRKLLKHSFSTVPYYHKKYKKHGFTIDDFKKFEIEDLSKLPFVEKEDFRRYGTSTMLSSNRGKGSFYSSGGSTGTPTRTYYSHEFLQIWFAAYESRVRNWAGVDINMKRGMIGGRPIIPNSKLNGPYYRTNYAENQIYFSAHHISEKTVRDYVLGMKKHHIEYMVGYALSNYFLADLIVNNDIDVPEMKAVLTSSEKLTPKMREIFKKAYGCKTYDAYSGVEACGLVSENEHGDFLWSPDVGIAEVIDNDKNLSLEGELVSTGLLNFDQPLIRYRIGDNIKLHENQNSKSGMEMPRVNEIVGRTEDAIITRDGRKLTSMYRLFLDIPHLKMSQVIQNDFENFEIKLVVHQNFNKKNLDTIKSRFFDRIGKNVELKISIVPAIQKTKAGKYRLTISNMNKHSPRN